MRGRAAGPPAFAATSAAEKAQAYVEFQGTVEDALEVLLEELDLVDQSEEFLMGLIGIDPEDLALPPQQQMAAMHICSLDERAWFDRAMSLESQAASNPVRRAALALSVEGAWCEQLEAFREAHKASFAVAGSPGTKKLDWAELHDEYQAAMEAPLEDVLHRLGLDAQDFLQQLAKGAHGAILASPLPPAAIEPLRAFAEYQPFEAMMRRAANEAESGSEADLGI